VERDLRLFRMTSAAFILDISLSTMYELAATGVLPRVELGTTKGKQRIRAVDLGEFIDARTFGLKQ
jgi:hypothetical protein